MPKPSIFVLGVQKCGTTTVANVLAQQPEIFVPSVKETYFFCDDRQYERGADWYESEYFPARFAGAKTLGCDATPFYFCSREAITRLASYCGADARFIVVLRDPVNRAYSAYWHQKRLGNEPLSFEEALDQEGERIRVARAQGARWWRHAYTQVGRYAEHLEFAFSMLGRERFLILSGSNLGDTVELQSRLREFLGLPATDFVPSNEVANRATMPKSRLLQRLVTEQSAIKRLAQHFVPRELRSSLGRRLLQTNSTEISYPPMHGATEARLRELFLPDQARIREMRVLPPSQ